MSHAFYMLSLSLPVNYYFFKTKFWTPSNFLSTQLVAYAPSMKYTLFTFQDKTILKDPQQNI